MNTNYEGSMLALHATRMTGRVGAKRQRGAALAMSLILLLILTLLAVTAVTTGSLGEKMAANLKDQRTAFQAAESGMRAGEGWIAANQFVRPEIPKLAATPCTTATHVCAPNFLGNLADASLYDNQWWFSYGMEYGTGSNEISQAKKDPRYVIEFRDFVRDSPNIGDAYADRGTAYYRVYGFGVGATESATAITASHFAFHIND
jgi:type IV pilus assembly protein PilX